MADKTPDPAEGARPPKRPAPTIDLPASEVKREPEPEAAAESGTKRWAWPQIDIDWRILTAGFAGAALMTGALAVLWLAGLIPGRYDVAPAADSASITALNERVGKVESATAKIPNEAGDNAMRSMGVALTALNKRSDEVAASAADARARAAATEKAVTDLRASVQDLGKNAAAGQPSADIDAVQKRLAALEQMVKTGTVDNAARLALSAAALRDAVASGKPFTAELDEVKSLGADTKALSAMSALAPFAANGVPTEAALAGELRTLIPAMLKSSGAQAPAGNFLERLQANAGKLVRVRPVDAPAGDDASAVLARLEIEAAHADIGSALADLGRLDATARAPAQAWIAKAQARQAAIAAARELAADAARALGKR